VIGFLILLSVVLAIGAWVTAFVPEHVIETRVPGWMRTAGILGGLVFTLLAAFLVTGSAVVPPTHRAVVENTWSGEFHVLTGGTHVFPIGEGKHLVPLLNRVTKYDLRQQQIKIGNEPAMEGGVSADSNSPGRPVVFFVGTGWAAPNPDTLIQLHRRYGPGYLDNWVERVWQSELKAIQGERPYNYVGDNRIAFQNEVEISLQMQLVDVGTEDPLVIVSQLAVSDYDFSNEVNQFLDAVAQKQFEQQQAQQNVRIAEQVQRETIIRAQTTYSETVRLAEADKKKVVLEAEAHAESKMLDAEAEAFRIQAEREATAEGVRKVQAALASSPEYLMYKKLVEWNGGVPQTLILGIEGAVPILDLLP
jgi:regulator of protease activity HflC (stomatin/prohibitin superfamily)